MTNMRYAGGVGGGDGGFLQSLVSCSGVVTKRLLAVQWTCACSCLHVCPQTQTLRTNTNTSTIKNTRKGKKCVKMEIQTQVQIFIVMKFIRRSWLPCWLRFDLTNQKRSRLKGLEGLACPEDFKNLERRRIESKDLNAGYLSNVMPSSKVFSLIYSMTVSLPHS